MPSNLHRALFAAAAALAIAGCGGSGGGGGGDSSPPPPGPTPIDPNIIQAAEISPVGTTGAAGLALDTMLVLSHTGILLERFQPVLALPNVVANGGGTYACNAPIAGAPAPGSRVTVGYTDVGNNGVTSGDTLNYTYNYCGDSGLPIYGQETGVRFRGVALVGNPLGGGDWSVSSPGTSADYWEAALIGNAQVSASELRGVTSVPVFGGRVARQGTSLATGLYALSGVAPFSVGYSRAIGGVTTQFGGKTIYLPASASPLQMTRDAAGTRVLNGTVDLFTGGLSWFVRAGASQPQGVRLLLQNVTIADTTQANNRRAAGGAIVITPIALQNDGSRSTAGARTGYSVRVDILDAATLRLRVFADGNLTPVSDTTAMWADVLWDYRTAVVQ